MIPDLTPELLTLLLCEGRYKSSRYKICSVFFGLFPRCYVKLRCVLKKLYSKINQMFLMG